MTIEELLGLIALATIVTTIIQCLEMYLLLRSSRDTNEKLDNLGHLMSDGVHQWIADLAQDKEKQEAFFGLIQIMGQAALEGVRGATAGKPVKLRGWAKVFEPLVNSPEIQAMIAERLGQTIQATGKAGAKAAADKVAESLGGF